MGFREKQSREGVRRSTMLEAALSLQQAGESQHALEILELVKKENPAYAPAHLLLGIAHQSQGDLGDAEAAMRRALDIEPDYPEALQALGLLLASKDCLQEAVDLLKSHLQRKPDDPTSLKGLIAVLLRLGREEEALRFLQKIWEDTGAEEPGVQFGRLLIQSGRFTQAEEVLRGVAEKLPKPRTLSEWALALSILRRYEAACQTLETAVRMDPEFDRAWRGLAYCHEQMGEHQQALEAANHALTLNEHHYRNWQAQGSVLLSLGRNQDAIEAARRGIKLIDPDDEEARPVLYELLLQEFHALVGLGDVGKALGKLEEARQRFPLEERFPRFQASFLAHMEKYEEALRVLDEAHQAGIPDESNLVPLRYEVLHALGRPDDAWAIVHSQLDEEQKRRLNLLGDVGFSLYIRDHVTPARRIFEQLHRFASNEPRFSSNLGFILVGDGKLSDAEKRFQEALEASGSEEWRLVTLCNLGYLYLITEQYARAREALEEADRLTLTEKAAILRVAYWHNGAVIPDYLAYPRRLLRIRSAMRANQVALMLALGQSEEAETAARQIIEEEPAHSLGHMVLGSVLLTRGGASDAQQAWEAALERSESTEERRVLTGWLGALQ